MKAKSVLEQHAYNTKAGPHHLSGDALAATPPQDAPVRLLAYYLPQFHTIPENDKWWGKGFTEWTNVTKAVPKYRGHFQPRLPSDLGFYDLADSGVLAAQAALARRAGIEGFCIHNYWFGGRFLLEKPLKTLLARPEIDIGFCLNWANENWTRRWDGRSQDILIGQDHSPADDIAYAESLRPSLDDPRYIRVNGRPLIMLYRPGTLPDARATVERWREHLVRSGYQDPYIVMPQAFGDNDPRVFGMDAACGFPPHKFWGSGCNVANSLPLYDPGFTGQVRAYDDMVAAEEASRPDDYRLFPGVCPAWDNEARRSNSGLSFFGATPDKYASWLENAGRYVMDAGDKSEAIVFINAWNEWAEGAYLEPDRHYGYAYLAATRRALDSLSGILAPALPKPEIKALAHDAVQPAFLNRVQNAIRRRLVASVPQAG